MATLASIKAKLTAELYRINEITAPVEAQTLHEAIDNLINGYGVNSNIARVTYKLTNSECTPNITSITIGDSFEAFVSPISGYVLESVTVTMDGVDVSDLIGSGDGNSVIIAIPSVTGDVVITAVAKFMYVNQIPLSTDADGNIYNGVGYKEGLRLGSDGVETSDNATGVYITGFISDGSGEPISGKWIRFKNLSFNKNDDTGKNRIILYDADKNFLQQVNCNSTAQFGSTVVDESGNWISAQFSLNLSTISYMRLCTVHPIDSTSIITITDELVTY